MRRAILRRDPVCVACGVAASTVADHVRSHAECLRAGIEPDTLDNGQGMCATCHDLKTRREQRIGLNAWRRPTEKHPGLT